MSGIGPRPQTSWDWRAAGNFIGGGSGAGLLCAAALDAAGGGDPRVAVFAALVLVAAGLALVWLEIGRPLRFLNVYRQPARSWMTREAYVALPLFAAGALALLWPNATATTISAAFGLIFLYCQARILGAAKGIPTWREPALLPLVVVTGLCEGAGLFILIAAVTGPIPPWIAILLALLIVARMTTGSIYHRRLGDGRCPAAALDVLARWRIAFVVLGHMLPIALLALGWLAPSILGLAAALAALPAVASGWALKFVIVTRAAYTQGFALSHRPARGPAGSGGGRVKPGWS